MKRLKSKISKVLVIYIVLFSSAITLILTAIQLRLDYNEGINARAHLNKDSVILQEFEIIKGIGSFNLNGSSIENLIGNPLSSNIRKHSTTNLSLPQKGHSKVTKSFI